MWHVGVYQNSASSSKFLPLFQNIIGQSFLNSMFTSAVFYLASYSFTNDLTHQSESMVLLTVIWRPEIQIARNTETSLSTAGTSIDSRFIRLVSEMRKTSKQVGLCSDLQYIDQDLHIDRILHHERLCQSLLPLKTATEYFLRIYHVTFLTVDHQILNERNLYALCQFLVKHSLKP